MAAARNTHHLECPVSEEVWLDQPEPSAQEKAAWKRFQESNEASIAENGKMSEKVMRELGRLCDCGNRLALSFRDSLPIQKRELMARKLPQPKASPKEAEAWRSFQEMTQTLFDGKGQIPEMVMRELERLCEKGNPLALRFREKLSIAEYHTRKPDEPSIAPPPRQKIRFISWHTQAKQS